VTHFIQTYGLAVLFLLVALESSGVPLPGETALVTAAVLASRGDFSIVEVLVLAIAGAILGDNIGYWIGRKGGRKLAKRYERLERILPAAERFFERHGGKAVFFARFIAGLRVAGAWVAGIGRMPWWRFLAWNAAGGIVWALTFGLVAYFFGRAAGDAIAHYGLIGGGVVAAAVVVVIGGLFLWRRRMTIGEEGA
jgi:membrane protein DedA with SNARE-associated domain